MKLLFCEVCGDVRKLPVDQLGHCDCGRVMARYRSDEITAEWNGAGYLLGIANTSLLEAIMCQRVGDRPDGLGHVFTAFILPDKCGTVRKT